MRGAWAIAFLGWSSLVPACRRAEARPELEVRVASSLVEVPKRGNFAAEPALALEAARGEYENAQIVVRAGGRALTALSARASALAGPDGARLPAPRLYRVG